MNLPKIVVFVALVAGLGYVYQEAQRVAPSQREFIAEKLRELKEVDTEWNVQVLRSKTGLNKHYDPVTQPERVALQLLDEISPMLPAYDYRLRANEQQLREALLAKTEAVDRFKAQNAILRNSMRFIPLATNDLKAKAREAGEANAARRNDMAALAASADLVLINTLKLETARDSESNNSLRQLVGSLVQRRSDYPSGVGESFDTFVNHVITISAQKDREDQVLDELSRVPVAAHIQALDSAFRTAAERAQARHERYTLIFNAYAGFLLVLFAFLLGRGRRAALKPAMA
jgi:two-component system NtrC family sensor kinase